MAHIAALYRYPIKGLTPEAPDTLTIGADGRVVGDRVLGVRFADTEAPDDDWSPKAGMLALVNTPGLARLQVHYDEASRRIRIDFDNGSVIDEALDAAGRARLAQALASYAAGQPENPLSGHPERLPLRIVGDGQASRYHDSQAGEVTLHGRASLAAVGQALDATGFDERRFRSNIAVDGLEPWAELDWVGRTVRIGETSFEVSRVKRRCLATHANPETGERDCQVMTTLTHAFGQAEPTFAVSLRVLRPGVIRLGDPVEPA